MSQYDSSPPPGSPTKQDLKMAMRAFKRRLKLMRLDEESRVGVGPMSGGKSSAVVAITPPDQFPQEVWDELVKQGRLKTSGNGLYEMV